jgi:hypothetical protein
MAQVRRRLRTALHELRRRTDRLEDDVGERDGKGEHEDDQRRSLVGARHDARGQAPDRRTDVDGKQVQRNAREQHRRTDPYSDSRQRSRKCVAISPAARGT